MMRQVFLVVLISLLSHVSFGQYLKGKITDQAGISLPGANVYVKGSTYGVSTNSDGKFSLQLKAGTYEIVFDYLGYQSQTVTVDMNTESQDLDVTLAKNTLQLNDVEIVADARDKGKEILKKVRENRSTYLKAIDDYTCESYRKASVTKQNVRPKLSDTLRIEADTVPIHKNPNLTVDSTIIFPEQTTALIEASSIIYHRGPSKYKQEYRAYKDYADHSESIEYNRSDNISITVDDFSNPTIAPMAETVQNRDVLYNGVLSSDLNFYQNYIHYPIVCNKPILSPIAATSAVSYLYDYLGVIYDNGKKIYQIGFKPISKTEALLEGTMLIEDSTWALIKVEAQINPPSLLLCKEFNINQTYGQIDSTIYLPQRIELEYLLKDGQYDIVGKVIAKHSDYKVNTDINPRFFNNEIVTYQDEAFDRDSSYWEENRLESFQKDELDFIDKHDSLAKYYISDAYFAEIDSAFNRISWWTPLIGFGHRNRMLGTEWYISGLLEQVIPLGIGGYRHRLPAYINKDFNNGLGIDTRGFIDYGFRNGDVKGEVEVGFKYNPLKQMKTAIRVGDTYERINNYASIEQTFSRSNFVRRIGGGVTQQMEVINGLYAKASFDYSDQDPINDIQLSQWSNLLFDSLNTPIDFKRYVKSEIKLELLYRINQKYVIKRGRKMIYGRGYPEIKFTYRKGLPQLFGSEVNFDFVQLSASDQIDVARFGTSSWQVEAGTFLNTTSLRLLEYKYFRGSDLYYFSNPVNSFQNLSHIVNTPNEYISMNYSHQFEGSLMNKIPLINNLKMDIAAGGGALLIPDNDMAHFEAFVGINKLIKIKEDLLKVGVYAAAGGSGIEDYSTRIKWSISFFNPFTQMWEY